MIQLAAIFNKYSVINIPYDVFSHGHIVARDGHVGTQFHILLDGGSTIRKPVVVVVPIAFGDEQLMVGRQGCELNHVAVDGLSAAAVAFHAHLVGGSGCEAADALRTGSVAYCLPFAVFTCKVGIDGDVVDINIILIIRCSIYNGHITIP